MTHEVDGFEELPGEDRVPPITRELIGTQLGYRLVVTFPGFETDKACMVEFHEQLDHLEERFGAANIFGSLFYEEDELQLGLFVNRDILPTESQP